MISTTLCGTIELGNVNIKCVIFNIKDDNSWEVLSSSLVKTQGIHNGVIVNPSKATSVIRLCISEAEKKAGVQLKKINVIFEQPEFLCTKFSKYRKIDGAKIHQEDIEFLLKESKKEVTRNDLKQKIIHIFNHNYIVDGKTFIEEPIDVYADSLSHEMTFITMPKNNIKNIYQVFIDCDIEIERMISTTFALAAELLGSDEFKFGSILIDIGSEKTSLGVFKNFALIHSTTFPIGINHLTKDISKVFSLNLIDSENIRNKIDFSFENKNTLFDDNAIIKEIFFKNSNFKKISKNLIYNVVKFRLEEIFGLIRKQINLPEIKSNFGVNFFITGGGSNLLNIENFCSNFFNADVKKLQKGENKSKNLSNSEENFIACLGALKIIKDGWETEAIPESPNKYTEKMGFFSKIFGERH